MQRVGSPQRQPRTQYEKQLPREGVEIPHTRGIGGKIPARLPRGEIDPLYVIRPYFVVPDGKLGQDGFAIIREILRSMSRVALARVTLTNIERIIALDPYDKGMIGMLLRFPYEVRELYGELVDRYRDDAASIAKIKPIGDEIRKLEAAGELPSTMVARSDRRKR